MKFAVNAAEGREAENYLSLLYDLAQILTSTADVQNSLDQVLMLLAERLHMMQGTITLVSPQTGEIRIESSYGLKPAERSRGRYVQGEGIIGRVVQTGQPMYISNVSEEPLFLNRTRSRDLSHSDISYICVPIRLNQQVVGALSVDRLLTDQVKLEEEQQLMTIIATLLGYAAWETQRKMDEENVPSKRPKGFVGNSDVMQHVYAQIMQVAQSPTTVFLQGESGTGKELAARAIHAASARAERPFVSLNCAALPESLIESELFGHEKGAFTGATSMRKGRFEQADGGTLFLDEVGELSMMTQAKLLRVLQERSFERLGGMETIRVDVRVITATNRNLEKMVAEGTFRRDLFYRLNVFPIVLPPLRDRQDDILPLASHFVGHFARQAGKGDVRISLAAMDMLQRYSWPGNIRELHNVAEYFSYTGQEVIRPEDLPPTFLRGREMTGPDWHGAARQKSGRNAAWRAEPEACSQEGQKERSMEFWFVLEQLCRAAREGRLIGRESILAAAREAVFPLSQKEVRGLLEEMEREGLAKIGRGRGGSRITPAGMELWKKRQITR